MYEYMYVHTYQPLHTVRPARHWPATDLSGKNPRWCVKKKEPPPQKKKKQVKPTLGHGHGHTGGEQPGRERVEREREREKSTYLPT